MSKLNSDSLPGGKSNDLMQDAPEPAFEDEARFVEAVKVGVGGPFACGRRPVGSF